MVYSMAVADRRPKRGKPIGVRLFLPVEAEVMARVEQEGTTKSGFMADVVTKYLRGDFAPPQPDITSTQIRIKLLGAIPCGPLREALEETQDLPISRAVATRYRIDSTDFAAIAEGESMMGTDMAHEGDIRDGDLIVFKKLEENERPTNRDIVAVQLEAAEGVVEGTIKRWHNGGLIDGEGRPYAPAEGKHLKPLGVALMLMRKL